MLLLLGRVQEVDVVGRLLILLGLLLVLLEWWLLLVLLGRQMGLGLGLGLGKLGLRNWLIKHLAN